MNPVGIQISIPDLDIHIFNSDLDTILFVDLDRSRFICVRGSIARWTFVCRSKPN